LLKLLHRWREEAVQAPNGRRNQDRAFAEGRGPDPATRDAMKDGFIFDDEPLR
jgi:hypothetical protein